MAAEIRYMNDFINFLNRYAFLSLYELFFSINASRPNLAAHFVCIKTVYKGSESVEPLWHLCFFLYIN